MEPTTTDSPDEIETHGADAEIYTDEPVAIYTPVPDGNA